VLESQAIGIPRPAAATCHARNYYLAKLLAVNGENRRGERAGWRRAREAGFRDLRCRLRAVGSRPSGASSRTPRVGEYSPAEASGGIWHPPRQTTAQEDNEGPWAHREDAALNNRSGDRLPRRANVQTARQGLQEGDRTCGPTTPRSGTTSGRSTTPRAGTSRRSRPTARRSAWIPGRGLTTGTSARRGSPRRTREGARRLERAYASTPRSSRARASWRAGAGSRPPLLPYAKVLPQAEDTRGAFHIPVQGALPGLRTPA
jgi:hypothetical protein